MTTRDRHFLWVHHFHRECSLIKKWYQTVRYMYVECTLRNESPNFALHKGDSLRWGYSCPNFKVRFFLRTKVRESTKKNNLLMSGGTQQSQILAGMLILRFLLWLELILLCVLMEISWKVKENVRHTLKNRQKIDIMLGKRRFISAGFTTQRN